MQLRTSGRNILRTSLILTSLLASSMATPVLAAVKLSPQTVVDLALTKGRRARGAELQAQRAYLTLQQALGVFDFQFKVSPYYQYTEAQTVRLNDDLATRTFAVSTSLEKKIRTGTTFLVEFQNEQYNVTRVVGSALDANVSLNTAGVGVRQALWRNAFGYADRLGLIIGRSEIDAALETREEDLEQILLDAMTLYWDTYTAERQLKENIAAREKYEQLVKNVRRKAGFNLSTPGELPRLQAEFEGAEQKVKSSSAAYLESLQKLLTAIQFQTKEQVELEVPAELPPVPQLRAKDLANLRKIRAAATRQLNAERRVSTAKSNASARFDLVARARSTGVENENGASLAEMTANTKPTYYVGIEFESPLDSDLNRGNVTDAEVQLRQAENDLAVELDNLRDEQSALERQVVSQYAIAKSAAETVELRARVVRELETAYRQGRQPLVELIRAYNELFNSQLERARTVGNYHITLNKLAAARDELVNPGSTNRNR